MPVDAVVEKDRRTESGDSRLMSASLNQKCCQSELPLALSFEIVALPQEAQP